MQNPSPINGKKYFISTDEVRSSSLVTVLEFVTSVKMFVKVLDSFTVCVDITFKRHRNFLWKSHALLTKRQFCSKKDQSDLPEETDVRKLLDSSSPLRPSVRENDFWATSAYPEGTFFRDVKSDEEDESLDPSTSTSRSIILFPGQGNQFVGMAKNLMKYPVAIDMFKSANEILGYDLLKICLEGPEEVLNDTKHCQPATFVCSLALLEKLKIEKPWAISNCVATCGYSLGELTALVFAGCVNFERGLRLVKKRCEAMAECCSKYPGGMVTIMTGPRTTLGAAFSDAIEHCKANGIENPQCAVASYLFPNCKVIAGNTEALDFIEKNAKKYFIRRLSQLPVSGAFHTLLMKEAAEPFKKALKNIELQNPIIKILSNVTGKPYINAKHIESQLPKQIYKPVKWEQIMHYILSAPKQFSLPYLYECGPGDSLCTVAKKNNGSIEKLCCSIKL